MSSFVHLYSSCKVWNYLLTYLHLLFPMEHGLLTSIFQPTLSYTFLSSSIQLLFIFLMSVSISRRNMFVGLAACLVTQLGAFLNVCHIHFHASS
ncbi:unnamed protein product [Schistosoma guineensis]|nr:unnamed protein product [Schistosoma guineensis]